MNKIYLMCLAFTASLLTWSSSFNIVSAQSPDVVIPVPAEVTMTKGTYKFEEEPKVKVVYSSKGFENPEAYSMKITPKGITIKASGDAGVFYARQTLMQMTADGAVKEIACCEIYDEPRFPYRGMHFDVSRHFRSLDFLKKQVDAMASFKMNRMHIRVSALLPHGVRRRHGRNGGIPAVHMWMKALREHTAAIIPRTRCASSSNMHVRDILK